MSTRREFLRTAAGAALAPALCLNRTAAAATPSRPNILILLADDMGFSDLGCYGGEIATPNIDRLAAEGLRFTQFYNAARCCPTRAALLTGLYPHQAGMGEMVSTPEKPRPAGPYQGYLNDRCVTIAEALRPAGYKTYMSGKWHVGEAPGHWPRKRGFDRYYGLISGGSSYWELLLETDRERCMASDDTPFKPEPGKFYMTDAFGDHAVEFLEQHPKQDPFFMYLAFTSPHWPLHAWPEDVAKYRGRYKGGWDALREARHRRQIELGIVDPKWPLSPRDPDVPAWESVKDEEDWDQLMAVYAAMVDRMDQNIGRVLRTLDEQGLAENTLVMFLSDNGGCHEDPRGRKLDQPGKLPGERGSFVGYRRPWANASNTPFRMFKHWTHEGGIATPLVAKWPGVIQEGGKLTGEVGHVIDLMATCLDVAGAKYPVESGGQPVTPLEGRSLAPIFQGQARESHPQICWEHFGNRAIRAGNWKLVAPKQAPWELYDLEADRTELNNLAGTESARGEALLRDYEAWAERCGVNARTATA